MGDKRKTARGVGGAIAAALVLVTPAYGAYHGQWFHTPSNNVRCDGQTSGVQCWVMSTATRSHYPRAWLVRPHGQATSFVPNDGPGSGPALQYGSTWSRGALRCRSRVTGLTCWSVLTGHGFFLSRARQRTF